MLAHICAIVQLHACYRKIDLHLRCLRSEDLRQPPTEEELQMWAEVKAESMKIPRESALREQGTSSFLEDEVITDDMAVSESSTAQFCMATGAATHRTLCQLWLARTGAGIWWQSE
eukprot:1145604-Pelagomonas_calceolata.AAC.3